MNSIKFIKKTMAGLSLALVSSLAFAVTPTPFYNMSHLSQIPDIQVINPNWDAVGADGQNPYLQNLTQPEIQPLVKNMRDMANTTAQLNNAIGLHSGMALRKEGIFTEKLVRNWEGLDGLTVFWKKNNITWYPDYQKLDEEGNNLNLQGLRITTGRFNMGNMPLVGQAQLEIPLENIKKEINGTKVWFKAKVAGNDDAGYTTNLPAVTNFYQILNEKAPILDFLGYYDTATGEWKVKIVINSKKQINTNDNGYPGVIHPKLDMEIYSQGYALQ